MAKEANSKTIHRRITEIDSEIASLKEQMDALAAERKELEYAFQILTRLTEGSIEDVDSPTERQDRSPHQPHSVPDMIKKALSEVPETGMKTADLEEVIKSRWKSDLGRSTLATTLTRLRISKEIVQVNRFWRLA